MQALNVQFLNQQAVSREKIDLNVKQNSSSDSFKSLLEKASASKKSDAKKASLPVDEQAENVPVVDEESQCKVAVEEKVVEDDTSKLVENVETSSKIAVEEKETVAKDELAQNIIPTDEQNYNELISLVITQQEQESKIPFDNFVATQKTNDIPLETEVLDATEPLQNEVSISNITIQKGTDSFAKEPNAQEVSLEVAENSDTFESVLSENMQKQTVASNLQQKETAKDSELKSRVTKNNNTTDSLETSTQKSIFTVVDERGELSKNADLQKDSKEIISEVAKQNAGTIDSSMALANNAEQNILSSNNQVASANGSTFQEMLSNQIQQNAPEFVKAGSIILKDSNTGTINMNLKPESLGNVKISLQLSDNGIEGRITVASKEAFEAFKQNIDTLKTAFQQSGFDTTNFSLSYASSGDSGSFQQGQQQQGERFFANKTFGNYAQEPETSSSTQGVANAYSSSDHHIDVVA